MSGAQESVVLQALPNTPTLWKATLPKPPRDVCKYTRGHCLVVSGSKLHTGAARLAATAALNNGAGAVTIVGDQDALCVHAAHVTAIMLREAATIEDFTTLIVERRFDAVVIGPAAGIGAATLARIKAAKHAAIPLVLDADALTSLVGNIDELNDTENASVPCIMTPHAGEFDRLFASLLLGDAHFAALTQKLQQSKLEQARAASRIAAAVVVFKGAETVIAAPDGRAAINTNAGPELATAGTGDVLSGLIGAHLVGGMPAFEAAAAAVWLHGFLGASIGIGLTADRLVEKVRPLAAYL